MGAGYQRGNIFYLPSVVDVRFPSVASVSALSAASVKLTLDSTLLGFHCTLSHIGVQPLKLLLKQLCVTPTAMNEIEIQKCPVCI